MVSSAQNFNEPLNLDRLGGASYMLDHVGSHLVVRLRFDTPDAVLAMDRHLQHMRIFEVSAAPDVTVGTIVKAILHYRSAPTLEIHGLIIFPTPRGVSIELDMKAPGIDAGWKRFVDEAIVAQREVLSTLDTATLERIMQAASVAQRPVGQSQQSSALPPPNLGTPDTDDAPEHGDPFAVQLFHDDEPGAGGGAAVPSTAEHDEGGLAAPPSKPPQWPDVPFEAPWGTNGHDAHSPGLGSGEGSATPDAQPPDHALVGAFADEVVLEPPPEGFDDGPDDGLGGEMVLEPPLDASDSSFDALGGEVVPDGALDKAVLEPPSDVRGSLDGSDDRPAELDGASPHAAYVVDTPVPEGPPLEPTVEGQWWDVLFVEPAPAAFLSDDDDDDDGRECRLIMPGGGERAHPEVSRAGAFEGSTEAYARGVEAGGESADAVEGVAEAAEMDAGTEDVDAEQGGLMSIQALGDVAEVVATLSGGLKLPDRQVVGSPLGELNTPEDDVVRPDAQLWMSEAGSRAPESLGRGMWDDPDQTAVPFGSGKSGSEESFGSLSGGLDQPELLQGYVFSRSDPDKTPVPRSSMAPIEGDSTRPPALGGDSTRPPEASGAELAIEVMDRALRRSSSSGIPTRDPSAQVEGVPLDWMPTRPFQRESKRDDEREPVRMELDGWVVDEPEELADEHMPSFDRVHDALAEEVDAGLKWPQGVRSANASADFHESPGTLVGPDAPPLSEHELPHEISVDRPPAAAQEQASLHEESMSAVGLLETLDGFEADIPSNTPPSNESSQFPHETSYSYDEPLEEGEPLVLEAIASEPPGPWLEGGSPYVYDETLDANDPSLPLRPTDSRPSQEGGGVSFVLETSYSYDEALEEGELRVLETPPAYDEPLGYLGPEELEAQLAMLEGDPLSGVMALPFRAVEEDEEEDEAQYQDSTLEALPQHLVLGVHDASQPLGLNPELLESYSADELEGVVGDEGSFEGLAASNASRDGFLGSGSDASLGEEVGLGWDDSDLLSGLLQLPSSEEAPEAFQLEELNLEALQLEDRQPEEVLHREPSSAEEGAASEALLRYEEHNLVVVDENEGATDVPSLPGWAGESPSARDARPLPPRPKALESGLKRSSLSEVLARLSPSSSQGESVALDELSPSLDRSMALSLPSAPSLAAPGPISVGEDPSMEPHEPVVSVSRLRRRPLGGPLIGTPPSDSDGEPIEAQPALMGARPTDWRTASGTSPSRRLPDWTRSSQPTEPIPPFGLGQRLDEPELFRMGLPDVRQVDTAPADGLDSESPRMPSLRQVLEKKAEALRRLKRVTNEVSVPTEPIVAAVSSSSTLKRDEPSQESALEAAALSGDAEATELPSGRRPTLEERVLASMAALEERDEETADVSNDDLELMFQESLDARWSPSEDAVLDNNPQERSAEALGGLAEQRRPTGSYEEVLMQSPADLLSLQEMDRGGDGEPMPRFVASKTLEADPHTQDQLMKLLRNTSSTRVSARAPEGTRVGSLAGSAVEPLDDSALDALLAPEAQPEQPDKSVAREVPEGDGPHEPLVTMSAVPGGGYEVVVSLVDDTLIARLLKSIHKIGVVVIRLPEEPDSGRDIRVRLEAPEGRPVEFAGTVICPMSSGIAIEVLAPMEEVLRDLKALRSDIERLARRTESQSDNSMSSATSPAREPSGGRTAVERSGAAASAVRRSGSVSAADRSKAGERSGGVPAVERSGGVPSVPKPSHRSGSRRERATSQPPLLAEASSSSSGGRVSRGPAAVPPPPPQHPPERSGGVPSVPRSGGRSSVDRLGSGSFDRAGSGSFDRSGSGSFERSGQDPFDRPGSGPVDRLGQEPVGRSGSMDRSGSGSFDRAGSGPFDRPPGSGPFDRPPGSGPFEPPGSELFDRSGSGPFDRPPGSGSFDRSGSGSFDRSGSGSFDRSGQDPFDRSGSGPFDRPPGSGPFEPPPGSRPGSGRFGRSGSGPFERPGSGPFEPPPVSRPGRQPPNVSEVPSSEGDDWSRPSSSERPKGASLKSSFRPPSSPSSSKRPGDRSQGGFEPPRPPTPSRLQPRSLNRPEDERTIPVAMVPPPEAISSRNQIAARSDGDSSGFGERTSVQYTMTITVSKPKLLERMVKSMDKLGMLVMRLPESVTRDTVLTLSLENPAFDRPLRLKAQAERKVGEGTAIRVLAPRQEVIAQLQELQTQMVVRAGQGRRPREFKTTPPGMATRRLARDPASSGSHERPGPPRSRPRLLFGDQRALRLMELAEKPPSFEATIDPHHSVIARLIEASSYRLDGVAKIASEHETWLVLLQHGMPLDIQVVPNPEQFFLGTLLLNSEDLTPERHRQVQTFSMEHRVTFGDALVHLGHMDLPEMLSARESRLLFMLEQLFAVQNGQFSFIKVGRVPYHDALPMIDLLQESFRALAERVGQLKQVDLERFWRLYQKRYPIKVLPPVVDIHELPLDEPTQQFYDSILSIEQPLWESLSLTTMSRAQVMQVILVVEQLGLVQFHTRFDPIMRITELMNQERAHLERLEQANLFERLGVHWSATDEEVEEGYLIQKARHALEQLPASVRSRARDVNDVIHALLDEAWEMLQSRAGRVRHRSACVDPQAVRTTIQIALNRGDIMAWARHVEQAQRCFMHVLELDPANIQARDKLETIQSYLAQRGRPR